MEIDGSIIKKLNLTKYKKKLLHQVPEGVTFSDDFTDWERVQKKGDYDCIMTFVLNKAEMQQTLATFIAEDVLENDGYIFIAYPKKNNKVYEAYVHRDEIFELNDVNPETGYIDPSDYKFSRMVSLNDVFTVVGIKKQKRKGAK